MAKKKKPVEAQKNTAPDVGQVREGYCLDCALYKVGGICGKSGRLTGALQIKKCCTQIESK